MNSTTPRIIAGVALLLAAALFLMEIGGERASPHADELLFPGLKEKINDVTTLTITRAGDIQPVTLGDTSGHWTVVSRDNYPADFGKVRAVLLAIADARILEEKTSDPALHDRLGLLEPGAAGSDSAIIAASGNDIDIRLILGHKAQSTNRYVRRADEMQTWLIDQDLDVPQSAGGWLANKLLDIDRSRIQSISISHSDGEVLRLERGSTEQPDFNLADMPAGRELTYSTVANGIAAALQDLTLDDVRRPTEQQADVTTRFDTFDGLSLTAQIVESDVGAWVSFKASSNDEKADEAVQINTRVSGWQFRIADHKTDLLTKRWDDLLKPVSE